MADTRICIGTNRDGGACSASPRPDSPYCTWHDPARAADRARWKVEGGKARSNRARARKQLAEQAMSISDLDALLCAALKQVATGRMQPGVGMAMAGIAKTITTIRTTGDFEKRLEELEAATEGGRSA